MSWMKGLTMSNYIKSPFNYTGTKYPELEELYSHFPKDCDTLVDLFCGGGSVFMIAVGIIIGCFVKAVYVDA